MSYKEEKKAVPVMFTVVNHQIQNEPCVISDRLAHVTVGSYTDTTYSHTLSSREVINQTWRINSTVVIS